MGWGGGRSALSAWDCSTIAEEGDSGSSPVFATAVLCDLDGGSALSEPQPSGGTVFQDGGLEAWRLGPCCDCPRYRKGLRLP